LSFRLGADLKADQANTGQSGSKMGTRPRYARNAYCPEHRINRDDRAGSPPHRPGSPQIEGRTLPHWNAVLCITAKSTADRPLRVITRIHRFRAYVGFHQLRTCRPSRLCARSADTVADWRATYLGGVPRRLRPAYRRSRRWRYLPREPGS